MVWQIRRQVLHIRINARTPPCTQLAAVFLAAREQSDHQFLHPIRPRVRLSKEYGFFFLVIGSSLCTRWLQTVCEGCSSTRAMLRRPLIFGCRLSIYLMQARKELILSFRLQRPYLKKESYAKTVLNCRGQPIVMPAILLTNTAYQWQITLIRMKSLANLASFVADGMCRKSCVAPETGRLI